MITQKPMVAGNWKMNGTRRSIFALIESLKQGLGKNKAVDVVLFPSFVHIQEVAQLLAGTSIALGAQNLYVGDFGAFTGEVSAPMLTEYGCRYVLIGHSERRSVFHESLALVAQKYKSAMDFNLKPILCIGETLSEREAGQTEIVIQKQLQSVIECVGINAFNEAIIAYEPVWAIGTGQTATPTMADDVHTFIRQYIAKQNVDVANTLRILYGGSVKGDNAASLFVKRNIDGGLIGGASLDAQSFLTICNSAAQSKGEG